MINFILYFFNKIKIYYQYFNLKIKIYSLIIDIFLIKLEYLIIKNNIVYEIIFFYKYNKILNIIFYFIETLMEELKKDYKVFKKNIKKFRLFHRDMNIFFLINYLFFFFAGIIPIIYLILLLYFLLKYCIKYILLSIDIYIYNYYDYINNEEYNIIINIYKNIRKLIKYIFIIINKTYLKIDKYLFRMERKKKLKNKIIELRFLI